MELGLSLYINHIDARLAGRQKQEKLMAGKIKEIEQKDYEREVLAKPLAVVDFYSTECPPCEALASKYTALSEIYGDDVVFVKIFRQGNRELAEKLDVTGSPTVLFYRDGELTGDKPGRGHSSQRHYAEPRRAGRRRAGRRIA
jgi:thioredoxin reductase (NADPH)